MAKGLDAMLSRKLDDTLAVAFRAMALVALHNRLIGEKREQVRAALKADCDWLVAAQGAHGGWGEKSLKGGDGSCDFRNTDMALHALHEAGQVGIEVPQDVWRRAQKLYYERQQPDGGWNFGDPGHQVMGGSAASYGSMTAAGLASIYLVSDHLGVGCPCLGGEAGKFYGDLSRHADAALAWLSREFKVDADPGAPAAAQADKLYWLYAAERAARDTGYKHFGSHDWY